MISRFRHSGLCLSSEQGSLLVEVMVGAVVMAIATLAVLSGLDGAQSTGAKNKARSQYSALAQQDIERLRSTPITALSNLSETRTVRVGSVDYTVTSETEWVRDATGVVSCTSETGQAEYLKVSSTVTSPNDTQPTPTKETTLLTPRPGAFSATSGTAAVLLTDRDGNPLPGIGVALSGPSSFSDTTNSEGCAIFGYIPAGSYTAQVSGGVTWASRLPATAPVTVNAGTTGLTGIEIEQPASLQARFETPTGVPGQWAGTDWSRITIAHAKLPAGFLNFPSATAATPVPSIVATNVFPHHDGYGVYAGSCEKNNPAFWEPSYFQPPSGTNGYIELDPGDNLKSVDVRMPRLTLAVITGPGQPVRVTATQDDGPECTEQLVDRAATSSNVGLATIPLSLPFGHYDLCVERGNTHKLLPDRNLTPAPAANPLDQTDIVNMTDPSGRLSGPCP